MQEPVDLDPEEAPGTVQGTLLARAGLDALRQAARDAQDDAEAQYRLGSALAQDGQLREAVPLLQSAIRIRPDHVEALVRLGSSLIELGNRPAGKAALRAALERVPDTYVRQFNLGNLLRAADCHVEAIAAYDAAIRIGPETASAHYNRGISLVALDRLEAAAGAYRRAVELDPDHAKAHNNLGRCLRRLERYAAAERALRRAIELDPDWFSPLYTLGRVLNQRERHGEAVVVLRQALRLKPRHVGAHCRLGVVLQEIGQIEAARASYGRALALAPDDATTHGMLAQIDTEPLGREQLNRLAALAASDECPPGDRKNLHFALAQRYDQIQEFGPAFEHLVAGNLLKRTEFQYDAKKDIRRLDRIRHAFNEDFFARHRGQGDSSARPIFILGMPRSGTTLIEQILASHSRVHGAGEIGALGSVAGATLKSLTAKKPEAAETVLAPDALREMALAYLKQTGKLAPHALRIVDKMLINYKYVGLIKLMLPNAHVIHTRRHPLDTCLSNFRKLFAGGLAFSYDLAELGAYYAAYARLMRHWHEVLPGFVLDVQYEDMIQDQRRVTERILAHCGLEWEDSCLRFHETQRLVRTASVAQVRQPIYRSSMGVWKRYGERLRPLIDALGEEIDPSELAELGDSTS